MLRPYRITALRRPLRALPTNAKTSHACVQGRYWPCRLMYSPRKRPRSMVDEPQCRPQLKSKAQHTPLTSTVSTQAVKSYHHHASPSHLLRLEASNDHPAQRTPPPHSQPAHSHSSRAENPPENPPSFLSSPRHAALPALGFHTTLLSVQYCKMQIGRSVITYVRPIGSDGRPS